MDRRSALNIYTFGIGIFVCIVFVVATMISCKSDSESTVPKTENTPQMSSTHSEINIAEKEIPAVSVKNVVEEKKETPQKPQVAEKEIKKINKAPEKKKTAKKPVVKKEKPVLPKEEPKAIITFDRMNHSFGEIKSGDKYEHKFHFTNTGNADLIIEKATATCGCTQPSFPFIPIAPGEKGFIGVLYNSVGKEGAQRPKVTVYTNTEPAIYNVYLEGEVLAKEEKEDNLSDKK